MYNARASASCCYRHDFNAVTRFLFKLGAYAVANDKDVQTYSRFLFNFLLLPVIRISRIRVCYS